MGCDKDIEAMVNEAGWNELMEVLAKCPVARENEVLQQVEKFNVEFKKLNLK